MSRLRGHELVVHAYVAADGPDAAADHRWTARLWEDCREAFALDESVRGFRAEPGALPGPEAAHEVLAVRTGRRHGVTQLVLRRVHDVLCLSLVRAPDAARGVGWGELEREWDAVVGPPTHGVLGTCRVLQARSATAPDPDAVLAAVVRDAGIAHGAAGTGVLVDAAPLGPFAVWEPPARSPNAPDAWDARADRRLVVVAGPDADATLSRWTWSRGTAEPTPLAGYLLAAARLRYELRVWRRADPPAAELRRAADAVVPARPADARVAAAAHAAQMRLVDRRTRLEDMRRGVGAAAWNMAGHVRDRAAGPFADDRVLADWFTAQLDSEIGDLDAARDRLRATFGAGAPPGGRRGPTTSDARALLERPAPVDRDRHPHLDVLGRRPRELQRVVNLAAGFQDVAPLAAGLLREAARVCRVEVIRPSGTSRGTGFLVGPDLMLTSEHVLGDVVAGGTPPGRVRCTFDHHVRSDGSVDDGSRCGLAPHGWLLAARPPSPVDREPASDAAPASHELDYALVRLDAARGHDRLPDGSTRGWVDLGSAGPVPVPGTPLLILQHPAGEPVKHAVDTAGVRAVTPGGTRVTYGVNTLPGSSGSPCFTVDLVPVAVHHAGADGLAAGRNEGVPLAPVVADLRERGIHLTATAEVDPQG